jgi:hypothetical protein
MRLVFGNLAEAKVTIARTLVKRRLRKMLTRGNRFFQCSWENGRNIKPFEILKLTGKNRSIASKNLTGYFRHSAVFEGGVHATQLAGDILKMAAAYGGMQLT